MSIGLLLAIFLSSFLCCKLVHKVTLRTFFKFIKKQTKKVKKEWDECDKN